MVFKTSWLSKILKKPDGLGLLIDFMTHVIHLNWCWYTFYIETFWKNLFLPPAACDLAGQLIILATLQKKERAEATPAASTYFFVRQTKNTHAAAGKHSGTQII
jgi:hypothetical protein